MMQKAIHASVALGGFEEASDSLRVLAESNVSACRLRRLTMRIGNERIAQVDQQTSAYQSLPLAAQQQCPIAMAPEVACIESDGGRMQIRDRTTANAEEKSSAGSHRSSYWRETKAAALLKLKSQTYDEDPCPEIPEVFVDAARMQRLSRQIKGFSAQADKDTAACETPSEMDAPENTLVNANELHASTRPEIILRSVLASTRNIHDFGKQLNAAAHARGFHAAPRKAFICDGMACNWNLHEKHFSRYTPILDFVHALCYVYHAAMAGQNSAAAWTLYCQWAQWLWSGQIELLLAALEQRHQAMALNNTDDSESSPLNKISEALNYLRNQSSRVNYPAYRKQGLPITSAHIESTIKQLNRRVKGTEKFWSTNADPILQLRADYLSQTQPMKTFWQSRCQKLPVSTLYKLAK